MRKPYRLWALLITGCLLGMFGQSTASFLRELFDYGRPVVYLTTITVISSILLLLVAGISMWEKLDFLLAITLITGGLVSMWSWFVLVMWWG